MKKILFLIALFTLMGGVNSVKAGKRYLTFSCPDYCNATWDSGTHTFTWGAFDGKTAEWTFMTADDINGDLRSWTNLHLHVSSFTNASAQQLNVVFKTNNGSWPPSGPTKEFTVSPDGKGNIDIDLTSVDWGDCDITNIQDLTIYGCNRDDDSKHGSVVITDCYLYKPTTISFNSSGVANIAVTEIVATGGFSITEGGVVTCDGTEGTLVINFDPSVDLTSLKRYDVDGPGNDKIIWRSIMDSQSTNVLAYYGSRWGGDLTGAERTKATAVNVLKWESKNDSQLAEVDEGNRTFTIISITLTADAMNVVNAHDVPIASLTRYVLDKDANVSVGSSISTNYGVAADNPLGDGNSEMDEYIDIEDYDELRIYTSKIDGNSPRVFFFNATKPYVAEDLENEIKGTYKTQGKTIFLDYDSANDDDIFSYNSAENYYYATITAIKGRCNGNAKVIGVKKKAWDSGAITVNKIQVYKENPTYDYVLSGQYSASVDVSSVTSDASATAVDCSALSGKNISLSPTNPNCLFVARAADVLSNTKNVIVKGITTNTCANFVLTDGNYPFKAPADFTATDVSYNRAYTENQASTVCLPFALSKEEAHAAGTFYTLTNYDGSTLTFTEIGAEEGTIAYKPYLFRAEEDGKPFNSYAAVNKPVSASDAISVTVGSGETATMTGTLAHQSVNGKYGWNSDDGVFSKAEDAAVTIDAFRAYISISGESLARVATLFIDNTVTGINEVSNSEDIKGVKNFEGKVFENGKLVIFKKGMKFNAAGAQIK